MANDRFFGACSNPIATDGAWSIFKDEGGVFARRTLRPVAKRGSAPNMEITTVVARDHGQDLSPREFRQEGFVIGHRRAQIGTKPVRRGATWFDSEDQRKGRVGKTEFLAIPDRIFANIKTICAKAHG